MSTHRSWIDHARTPPPDLADFLLARIAEDEAVARAATPGPWETQTMAGNLVYGDPEVGVFVCNTGDGVEQVLDDAAHIAHFHPARVLAECEAKRRIVALCQVPDPHTAEEAGDGCTECAVLYTLALPYADHPDYREEWRV